MSSKMHAGLVAGGFGAALAIGLALSSHFSPVLAYFLSLGLLFGLGILSGVLAAHWLDLNDYGHQQAAGAIAGLVAAGLTEVADLVLRLVFASISESSPTSALANLILFRLPTPSAVAHVLFMVLINLLLYLIYLLTVIGISSAVASIAGRAKTVQSLQELFDAQQPPFFSDEDDDDAPSLVDPALLPFMRPEYSPFVPEEPPLPVSPWQQRNSRPAAWRSDSEERRAERPKPPPDQWGAPPPRRNSSGNLNPSGVPIRGANPGGMPPRSPSGPVQRRPSSGQRPPPNAQWPKPRNKD